MGPVGEFIGKLMPKTAKQLKKERDQRMAKRRALAKQNIERLQQSVTPSHRKRPRGKAPGEGRRGPMAERGMKFSDFGADINTLTNWQRHQWAGHGYPGLRQHNSGPAMAFKLMQRHKRHPMVNIYV